MAKQKKAAKKTKARSKSAAKTVRAAKKVGWLAKGYLPFNPVAVVDRCGEAISFYRKHFGAKERMQFPMPDGKVAHAEISFGASTLFLADATPQFPAAPGRFCLYVKDVDATFAQVVAAGANAKEAPKDQFYGDRSGRVIDPFGNEWTLMTHVEDVSPKEMQRRMAAMVPPAA